MVKYEMISGNENDIPVSWKVCMIKGMFSDSNNIFLWHESEGTNIKCFKEKKNQRIQNRAARIYPYLARLHWLPVHQRVISNY